MAAVSLFWDTTIVAVTSCENTLKALAKVNSTGRVIFKPSPHNTMGQLFLNEVYLRARFRKSLDLEISFLVGYLKKRSAFPVYTICFNEIVDDKLCLAKCWAS